MSKKAFEKIAAGLEEALAVARGNYDDGDVLDRVSSELEEVEPNSARDPVDLRPISFASLQSAVDLIVALQKRRKLTIRIQMQCNGALDSFIADQLGYKKDASEKDRKAVFRRAVAFRQSVERGEGQNRLDTQEAHALSALIPFIIANAKGRAPWDELRKETEAEMEKLAKLLPVWIFAQQVRGLGAKGLAILVAEAGICIGDYRTVSGLWKRMGLAVINGERQRKKKDKEEAAQHKYSPRRRAEVWSIVSDSMFRAQWRGAKDADGKDPAKSGKAAVIEAHPIGPYGEVYQRRRERTACRIESTSNMAAGDPQKWTKGRCHNDARRIMTKELLKDLWVEWRRCVASEVADE